MMKGIAVDIIHDVDRKKFCNELQPKRRPCVLRGMDIGTCSDKWSAEYICSKSGNVPVKVHVSESPQMNFITKNYLYKTLPFDELVRRASETTHTEHFLCEDEYYYLRSLGTDVRKDVADIKIQFPQLADDIIFPDFFDRDAFFSSVFRIASKDLQLWTHYDIMDNLLIQIMGRKRVVLFPPTDVDNLYLQGDKSKIADIDNPDLKAFPLFARATRYEVILEAGDVLFIPALWFHNVTALDFGIAVNVFWKNLPGDLYDRKDPYGNKDLVPASRAVESLKRALSVIDDLPSDYKDFYGRKMMELIKTRTSLPK